MFRQRHEDGPDEAAEFSGDGRADDVTVFAFVEPEELVDPTKLGLHGDGNDLGRLSLTSALEDQSCTSVVAVVPGGFDQEKPDVDIAGLGDGAAVLSIARGVLRGNETEVGQKRAWRSEAPNIANLDQEGRGGERLDAPETAECFHGLPVVRERGIAFKFCIEGCLFGLQILEVLEFGSQGRLESSLEALA